jgi:FMN-dependent NADH-azoreductase
MVSYKDKIITFPLFNTCYPQNLARFFDKIMIDLLN